MTNWFGYVQSCLVQPLLNLSYGSTVEAREII